MSRTDATGGRAAVAEAERRGVPFLELRDGEGELRVIVLERGGYALGRREEADIALPWDPEVSRLHAQLERVAGEWTICDDGLSQNGTFVNEMRVPARRRLADGDLVRLGRTAITFRDPAARRGSVTLLPGELTAAVALSEQQHAILRALCRPLRVGLPAATDAEIAVAVAVPEDVVATELRSLYGAFGLEQLSLEQARAAVAEGALTSGLVSFDEPST
ncbi:MAG TPA: FHA domain-containing protein [Solirubrobacteraceae bacterium]|nr:FHA domain-containing protein [Solirubrobacteraceae bacterium]